MKRAQMHQRQYLYERTFWPDSTEIISYSPTLLHSQSGFFQHIKNATHAIRYHSITKQLNNVTLRFVPDPAVILPAGKNLKSVKAL